ncbi:unnamed protein product [Phaeothamnion confervicola]
MRVGLKVGSNGVFVVLKLSRGGTRFALPVRIGSALDPWTILAASVVPAVVDAVVYGLLLAAKQPVALR